MFTFYIVTVVVVYLAVGVAIVLLVSRKCGDQVFAKKLVAWACLWPLFVIGAVTMMLRDYPVFDFSKREKQ